MIINNIIDVLNEAPKFGKDNDYVDQLSLEVVERTTKVLQSFKNALACPEHGGHYVVNSSGGATLAAYGNRVEGAVLLAGDDAIKVVARLSHLRLQL